MNPTALSVPSVLSVVSTPAPGWIGPVQDLAYLVAALLFIWGIKQLSSPRTARRGNMTAAVGMLIAIVATLYIQNILSLTWIIVAAIIGASTGAVLAIRVQMTAMPQLVAMFNGFGGFASVLVAGSEFMRRTGGTDFQSERGEPAVMSVPPETLTFDQGITVGLTILIGMVTFTGSLIAFGKLQGLIAGRPRLWRGQFAGNMALLGACLIIAVWIAFQPELWVILLLSAILAGVLGVTLTIAVGGADMPVMVTLLNSYSGLAACATGFILDPPNKALIVSGALVGASGIILTTIMCKAMNRSLANVMFGGVGTDDSKGVGPTVAAADARPVRSVDAEELAMLLDGARRVVIVPGYGMAVAQAQHAVRDLVTRLEEKGTEVLFGIHPVAGRMPGHMNVLLAEVDISYDKLMDLSINAEMDRTDVALVVGANDVVNPAARHDRSSPIYGMPIIDVDKAQTVVVLKRSLAAGYAGVENELFVMPNTVMYFGDAKKSITELCKALE